MITGLRNNEYLIEFFEAPIYMMESTGLSLDVCKKLMFVQPFQPRVVHLQALIKVGVDLNEYLTVKIEA
ncbi:MAG: hypothetical protein ABJG33_12580 [Balneola sp.]